MWYFNMSYKRLSDDYSSMVRKDYLVLFGNGIYEEVGSNIVNIGH